MRVVEPQGLHLFEARVREIHVHRHGAGCVDLDRGSKARLDSPDLRGLTDDLDARQVRVHVRRQDDHVQIPVAVGVEPVADFALAPGPADEVGPEELADRNAIRLPMLQRGNDAVDLDLDAAH